MYYCCRIIIYCWFLVLFLVAFLEIVFFGKHSLVLMRVILHIY